MESKYIKNDILSKCSDNLTINKWQLGTNSSFNCCDILTTKWLSTKNVQKQYNTAAKDLLFSYTSLIS